MTSTTVYSVAFWSLLSFVLLILSWRRPAKRKDLSLAALGLAAFAAVDAIRVAGMGHHVAGVATSSPYVDLTQKERILGEAYREAVPPLVLAAIVLVLVSGWCIAVLRTRRERIAPLALGATLLLVMGWLGTRGVGLHERTARAYFADVGTSEDGCLSLSAAVSEAGGMDAATSYEPRAREMAHQCVDLWLSTIERGDEAAKRLDLHAQAAHQLLRLKGTTALDLVAESNLLVDDAQRREVLRRKALAAAVIEP